MGLLQRVRSDTERFVNASVGILYSSIVGIGFVVWYGLTKNWMLIPAFGVGVVVLGGLAGLLSQKIKRVQRSIVRETARLSGTITESLRNIELVKSLGLTWPEIRRLQGYTRRIYDLEMEKVRKSRSLSLVQGTLVNILRQSILFTLLWLLFRKVLSAGELISFQLILGTILGPLQQLGRVILNYREAQASLQVFDRLMRTPIERRPADPVEIGEIERLRFDDVVFRHRGAAENAIDHISFEVKRGETIAFAGPSGSGKSTLVKLLVGLYIPSSGVVSMDGIPINDLRYNQVRRRIGFVTQDTQLFSGTIRENLQLVKPAATDAEMLDVLRRASAGQLLDRSGQGLDTRVGESGLRVSGGERQRLAIARALLREPRLFIFDEATSALDSITEQEITDAVREVSLSRQHMVILIAHRLSTIAHADRILVLERGRVVETGSHDELVEARGLYYAMWRQQVGEREPWPARPAPEPVAVEA
jgi:ATP-binding cassette subfamily B protein